MTVVDREVAKITKAEMRKALKSMKSGTAVGPDDIPVEVRKRGGSGVFGLRE